MKTSLSYLPQIKQDQILQVVDIIKEVASPEKVIPFGSYATNAELKTNILKMVFIMSISAIIIF